MEEAESLPVVAKLEFAFIQERDLRHIIERDFQEIQRSFVVKCWKSVIILTGGAIEAILLDVLLGREEAAKSTKAAPGKKEIRTWDLSDLIAVAVELELIEPIAGTLQNAVRLYRNLVHPGYELKNQLTFGQLEAESGLIVLRTIHRDLSRH